jgi:hypothetical protein
MRVRVRLPYQTAFRDDARSGAWARRFPAESVLLTVPNVPNPNIVMLLILLPDFLMYGVVLQNRVFRARSPDVSRETSRHCFT